MFEMSESPFRGRLSLSSSERQIPRRDVPLTEPERDALEVWLPKGAHIVTHTRGRLTREGRPVWVLTTTGVLLATLTDETLNRVRARVQWVAAEHVRRVDLISESGMALVRVVTSTRRHVLYGIDEDTATRFVALVRAAVATSLPVRKPRPRVVGFEP